jgi:hypothetical protein
LQTRLKNPFANWNPVAFNKILAEALFIYDLSLMNTQESFAESQIEDKEEDKEEDKKKNKEKNKKDNEKENEKEDEEKNIFCDNSDDQEISCSESDNRDSRTTSEIRKKRQYKKIYPHISPLKSQEILQSISKKIAAITDLKSILISRGHDIIIMKTRKAYFDYKILGKIHPPKKNAGGPPTSKDFKNSYLYINKTYGGCRQYNAPLCIHGECWKVYHNARKYI